MGKKILAGVIGVLVMGLVVMLVEGAGHMLFPPPPGLDLTDPASMAILMEQIPLQAKLAVLLAWMLGAFAGAWVAARIARPQGLGPAMAVGVMMLVGTGVSLWMIPHPLWMAVIALLTPLPLAWLAARIQSTGSSQTS